MAQCTLDSHEFDETHLSIYSADGVLVDKKVRIGGIGESAEVIKWLGVSAEFILVPKADLGLLFIPSKTDSWLKRFGRWGIRQPKAHLSGNVQRSWGEDFWVVYTWPWNQLGNLVSKWSWQVGT